MNLPVQPDSSVTWFWVLVTVLTSWRLSCLVCYDEGPFQVFLRLRKVMYTYGWKWVTCFHCVSVWMSAGVVLVTFELSTAAGFLIPAVAGAASMVERWLSPGAPDENQS